MKLPAAILALLVPAAASQAEDRGHAALAFQGYYLGGSSRPVAATSGVAVRFRHLLPKHGLLSGSLEGYGSEGRARTGENFIELRGAPWAGRYWTVTAGDFRLGASMVEFPFYNFSIPEIMGRGIQVQAAHGGREYSFFYGREMLQTGPRVSYRIQAPQTVLGASARYHFNRRWHLGIRFLRLSNGTADPAEGAFLLALGRDFRRIDIASVQSLYSIARFLRIYGEGGRTLGDERAIDAPRLRHSGVAGISLETSPVTLRVNYAYQGADYLPIAGYFAGDRRGPYADLRLRPWSRLEIYGSASRYTNNLEADPDVSSYRSGATAAGLSLTLPWRFSANGQISAIRFSSRAPGSDLPYESFNRQVNAGLARSFRRHTVRAGVRELRLATPERLTSQRTAELEDYVTLGRFSLGGSARLQRDAGSERRNTLFFRGSGQARIGRLTLYANMEAGNDLVNRTMFATNAYSSSAAGVTARLTRDWSLQVDAFRNRLLQELNPENVFVLETRGYGFPGHLSRFDQWNLFFRLTRQLRWGGSLPGTELATGTGPRVLLYGSVEGFVLQRSLAGSRPAAGVPVSLDNLRTATTDAGGRFHFSEVTEGVHRVLLPERELPAEFNPGPASSVMIGVRARRLARADLDVLPLTRLEGRVSGPEKAPLEGILVRLLPANRYTTTDPDGTFAFHNLPEGDYEAVVDPRTLPAGAALTSPERCAVSARIDRDPPLLSFRFTIEEKQKPVRRVVLQD